MEFLLYLLVGSATGVLAGLFGIGGGLIMVPVLIFSFKAQGVSADLITHMALATSLATIVFTSISSIRAHHAKQAVEWPLVGWISLGIVLGTILGGVLVVGVSGETLKRAFGIFALLVAVKMFFNIEPPASGTRPGKLGLSSAGGVIGFASAWFGIGGGTFAVPYLTWMKVPMRHAVATSAACGFPIALTGALTNLALGWNHAELPAWSTGFLYWPAILGMALTSVPTAKFGVQLAHRLDPQLLKKLFALLLVCIGVYFLAFK